MNTPTTLKVASLTLFFAFVSSQMGIVGVWMAIVAMVLGVWVAGE